MKERAYNSRSRDLMSYTCNWCGTEAIRPSADAVRQKYCSNSCAKRARVGVVAVPEIPSDFGHWLAGFVDGEGTFVLHPQKGKYVTPRFCIRLRIDDRAILEEIQRTLGFGLISEHRKPDRTRPNSKPTATFECRSFSECWAIVQVFRQFPLRAKKARDFAIWSEAVELGLTDCEDREAFMILVDKLKSVREFTECTPN